MIKLNYLFGLMSRVIGCFVVLALVLISSCKDDENPVAVATVQFSTEQQSISEAGTSATVLLSFDKAAGRDGTITISATEGTETDYTTHYLTNPNGSSGTIELEVSKGQTSTQFTFTPVNNALLQDDKTVTFTIVDVSSGFEIGANDSDLITINDDEGPTRANFATASSSTAENLTDGIDVTINLTNPAPGSGSVVVAFTSETATYTTNFITEPAVASGLIEVPVATGETSVHFKVKPVDDGSVNATRTITFAFEEATGAVEIGTTITSHTLSITDNETPSVATFSGSTADIDESQSESNIQIALAPETNGTGTVVIEYAGGTYGEDFTTDPEAVGGKITLNVPTATSVVTLKVIPVNDSEVSANREITFTLTESTGVVTLGETGKTYDVTILEDDAITTIADVRAAFPGTTTNITSSLRIHGVVTSSNPQVNVNNIWVQDATGGIVVRLVGANNNTIKRGDEVSIQLNGGQYFEFSGLLQIQNVPNANVTVNNENVALPTPEVITVAQLNSNAFEGKLVRINDVAFVDANGTATMSGTRAVSNGTTNANVRTEATAPHQGSVMPYGFGTITGLAGENGGAAQIIPIVFADDVFTSSPSGTIGITGTLADFGSVNTGEESADQSYVVQGTSLVGDIVVTASAGFKVSLTQGGTYESSVTIPAANANLATTVYVKFVPANGGAQNGTITHKSLGAANAVVNASGTGVGASPLQTLALWTFETSLPNSTGAVSANLQAEVGTQSSASIALGVHLSASTVYSNPAGNGSAESFSSNFWDANDYYQFATNSVGMADVKISWDQTRSGSGPSAFALYYSTDGTNFTKHADYTVIQGTWASGAAITTTSFSYDLSSVTALNNQATLVFRLVQTGSGISTGGTNRVDNVKVEAR